MSYNQAQARHLYNTAFAMGLSGFELLKDPDAVVRDCNGVGPGWMPASMRELCTKLNSVMEVPAAIHDRRYSIGTTTEDRLVADNEFLFNCNTVIEHEYAWWHPLRYWYRRKVAKFYDLLRLFGGVAFNYKDKSLTSEVPCSATAQEGDA